MGHDAVIFDLDGTLIDTLEDLGDATNLVLERHGYPRHPTQAFRLMVGRGLRTLVTLALPEGQRDERAIQTLNEELGARLLEHPVIKTRPYPGVADMLTRLERRGVPMGILTNKPDGLTQVVVDLLLEQWPFVGVYGQRDGVPRKPDPTAAIGLADELGSAPERVVFLGDSDVDMETATAAGMTAVGAGWGFRGSEELRAAGASRVIQSPLELLALFGQE